MTAAGVNGRIGPGRLAGLIVCLLAIAVLWAWQFASGWWR